MKENQKMHYKAKSEIGVICRRFREYETDYVLQDVAVETGFTKQAVQQFEYGMSSNMLILLWYIKKGLSIELIVKGLD